MCFRERSPRFRTTTLPEFTRVQTIGNVAEASYNSLSAKLTRRLSNGFSALIGYTLSKSEDNGSGIRTLNGDQLFPQNSNCVADEVSSGCEWANRSTPPPRGVVDPLRAAVWRGKKWAQGVSGRDSRWLAGHQHPEPVERLREEPERWRDRARLGHGDQRPNTVSGQDPNDGPNTIQQWFNTAAFVLQPDGEYGNAVRNSFYGPGIFNFDMSILRNFALGGSKSLQFRLEAFNTFNQPVWQDPTRR